MGIIGFLGRKKEHRAEMVTERTPARANKPFQDKRPAEPVAAACAPARAPRRRRRFGEMVENGGELRFAYLKTEWRIRGLTLGPGCTRLPVMIDGRRREVRLDWRPRSIPGRTVGWQGYFRCPDCGRRCAVLFGSDRGPTCRLCAGLGYWLNGRYGPIRWRRRALKIQKRLGLPYKEVLPELIRPKGMKLSFFLRQRLMWYGPRTKLRGTELTRKNSRRKTKPHYPVERI